MPEEIAGWQLLAHLDVVQRDLSGSLYDGMHTSTLQQWRTCLFGSSLALMEASVIIDFHQISSIFFDSTFSLCLSGK